MRKDLRESPEYAAVAEHVRQLHEPAFGKPHHVTDLVTTPDASRIVVTGSVYDELDGVPRTALYEVQDGALRGLTSGGGSAKAARLAPDGSALAFLSDRAKAHVFQLYLLADGQLGEARPAPAVPGTVEYLAWSPDGTRILLGIAGLEAEMADAQGSGTAASGESGLPSWYPEVEAGTPADAWRSLWLYTPASGELARISPDGLNVWEADWSGPGHVLAITSEEPGEDDWYSAALSRLDIATGAVTELLRSEVQLGLPAGTADGTRAAVVQAVCSDRWIVAGDLILLDLETGTRCAVDTAGTDVTAVQWIDGTRLGYFGQRHLDSVAGIADAGEGPLPHAITAKELVASAQSWTSWRLHARRQGHRDPGRLRPSARDRDRRHRRGRGAGLPGACRHRLPPIGRGLGDERELERTRRDTDRRSPVHASWIRALPAGLERARGTDRGLPAKLDDA
jgi:dipeptidyl aminopeptidase/acylaminoacyl peptidase